MNLLSLYDEVIEGYILPKLEWNDLLRFRRVCKTTWNITTAYMRIHPELAPELEVDEEDKSWRALLDMNIPTTRLYLNNVSGPRFFGKDQEDIGEFLYQSGYAVLIRCLRVKELSLYLHPWELTFIKHLPNLESLEADHFGVQLEGREGEEREQALNQKAIGTNKNVILFPANFNGLKRLKIGQEPSTEIRNVILYALFLTREYNLEYMSLPFNTSIWNLTQAVANWSNNPIHAMGESLGCIYSNLMNFKEGRGQVNTKIIDFVNYHDAGEPERNRLEFRGSLSFLQLCVFCLENGIKLTNVGANWFGQLPSPEAPPREVVANLASVILSVVNLHPWVTVYDALDFCNLEEIDIRATSRCHPTMEGRWGRPVWPALKILKINVDSKTVVLHEPRFAMNFTNGNIRYNPISGRTTDVFNFFFQNVSRPELTELHLKFQENVEVAIPKTQDIVAACPNLKTLSIAYWPGTNKDLVKLWSGLGELETVTLENCRKLGNVAFVGENREEPVFFKLTKLKKLSLKGLDQMPKITDTLFSLVVRRLKLTHLIITSSNPVQSVTLSGVESLLTGVFAETIEKFPFSGWSLKNAPLEEFNGLERKFRAFDMI